MSVERGPVFVAGLERSGTSLMFALLASHPRIAMTRRTNLWTHFYGQYGDLRMSENFERCLSTMLRYRRILRLEPEPERLRQEFARGEHTYARLFALVEQHHAERLGKPRWGDKSLNTERYAEPIIDAYPGARILHMIRDPRDRYASSQTRWQVRRGGVGAGTAEWLASARLALRNTHRFPQQYRVVRYETLATSPEQTVRDICAFVDEPYAPEMLSMTGAPAFRDRGSNSSYGRRDGGVISTDSIGRYRSVLSSQQIAYVQLLASKEMERFGYALDAVRLTGLERLRFGAFDVPLETARSHAWRAREAIRDLTGRPVPAYRLIEAAS